MASLLLAPLQRLSLAPCAAPTALTRRAFTTSPPRLATYNQVIRGIRQPQPHRRPRSPAMQNRTQMKGVCLRVGTTKPKKPNSGERKVARVRLSSGMVVNCYIPGEGECALEVRGRGIRGQGALMGGQVTTYSSIRSCWSVADARRIVRV